MNVLEASGLGKRHLGRAWALRECALAVPEGHVSALVGPNGAGKTTLPHLAAGLSRPTSGRITVLGGEPPGTPAALAGVGFVAQDAPLLESLTVADTLNLARNLNRRWDQGQALARLADLSIPLNRKSGRLSGGQQAQLALTLALAKRPRLLLLDEPAARLDPLARHEFMATLMAAVAEDGVSVIFSSHVIAELERVADHLVVLNHGRLQAAGEVEDLLGRHRIITGPAGDMERLERAAVVHAQQAGGRAQLLVRTSGPGEPPPPGWESSTVTLEELLLAYLREPGVSALPGPSGPAPAPAPAGRA